ncbi:MAG: S41 family peptidase, partial [Bacteroidota bacterium]
HPGIYRYTPKSAYDSLRTVIEGRLSKRATYLEFLQAVVPALHLLGCGHSGWFHEKGYMDYRNANTPYLPLDTRYIDGRLLVLDALCPDSLLKPGTEILTVNGTPMAELKPRMLRHIYADAHSKGAMESSFGQNFRNIYSNFISQPSYFRLLTRQPNGDTLEVETEGLKRFRMNKYRGKTGVTGWPGNKPLHFEYKSEKVGYLSVKTFNTGVLKAYQQSHFHAFIDSVFRDLKLNGAEDLVIDLRGNSGGRTAYSMQLFSYIAKAPFRWMRDAQLVTQKWTVQAAHALSGNPMQGDTLDFQRMEGEEGRYDWTTYPFRGIRKLPAHGFEGRVYVLMDEKTMSAGSIFCSMANEYGWAKLIGRETGGGYSGANSGIQWFILPNTQLKFFLARVKYALAVEKDDARQGVKPHVRVVPTIPEILEGKDMELESALELVKKARGD